MDTPKLSVIIADDERLICDLPISIINWDAIGLKLVDVATNGMDLLQKILDKRPDIVITDICMPDMDGIELIRQVREMGLPCRFVIVSGYRQFEYAHNAMRYDVDDYILKPIDADEINERLSQLRDDLLSVRSHEVSVVRERQGYQKLLLRHIINRIGTHALPGSLVEINSEFGTSFAQGCFRVAIIEMDILEGESDCVKNSTSISDSICSAMLTSVENLCLCVLTDVSVDRVELLLNYSAPQEQRVLDALRDGLTTSLHITDLFIGFKVNMGIGDGYDSLDQCLNSHREAETALWCRIAGDLRGVIRYDKLLLPDDFFKRGACEEEYALIINAIEILDINTLKERFESLLDQIGESFQRAAEIGLMLQRICDKLPELLASRQEKPVDPQYIGSELSQGLKRAATPDLLRKRFFEPIIGIVEQLDQEAKVRMKRPIRQAIQYMEDNYEKQLKLEDVAACVFLSATYFSNLFSREVGVTFCDYLTGIRMESAKCFLRDSDLSIGEISARVGYIDSRYFSKLFSKTVGIKPTEYRKIYG